MNLIYTLGNSPRTMVVRVPKAQLDELAIDSVVGNLQSLIFAFKLVDGVVEARSYRPSSKPITGEMMPDGVDAYRIEIMWEIEFSRDEVAIALQKALDAFFKNDGVITHRDASAMAVYTDDGDFDYYIGAGG